MPRRPWAALPWPASTCTVSIMPNRWDSGSILTEKWWNGEQRNFQLLPPPCLNISQSLHSQSSVETTQGWFKCSGFHSSPGKLLLSVGALAVGRYFLLSAVLAVKQGDWNAWYLGHKYEKLKLHWSPLGIVDFFCLVLCKALKLSFTCSCPPLFQFCRVWMSLPIKIFMLY